MKTKDTEVIRAFNIPVEKDELETIKETHKYITDKLILDALNGIKVVTKDLNDKNKSRQSLGYRLFDGITGSARKRQDLINENIIEGINACTTWLRDHDRHISRIDNRICIVADELFRTQDEIVKFYNQHSKLKNNVEELKEAFFDFKNSSTNRMNYLENWIKEVDIRDSVYNFVNREFERIRAGNYDAYDLAVQVYILLDNLKSGDAGIYYHSEIKINEKTDFQEYIKNRLINHFQDKCNLCSNEEFISPKRMVKKTNELDLLKKNILAFISIQHHNLLISENKNSEMSELISVVSNTKLDMIEQELATRSNIGNFIRYRDFIEDSVKEHLDV